MKSKRVGRAIGALIFSVIRRRDVRWKKNVAKFKEGVAFSGIAKRCLLLGESEHLISSSASLFMDPKADVPNKPSAHPHVDSQGQAPHRRFHPFRSPLLWVSKKGDRWEERWNLVCSTSFKNPRTRAKQKPSRSPGSYAKIWN